MVVGEIRLTFFPLGRGATHHCFHQRVHLDVTCCLLLPFDTGTVCIVNVAISQSARRFP